VRPREVQTVPWWAQVRAAYSTRSKDFFCGHSIHVIVPQLHKPQNGPILIDSADLGPGPPRDWGDV
jgi:hypothetical protein